MVINNNSIVFKKIFDFIEEMEYLNNECVLGILFYGSCLTGFDNQNSDIDLHIIFDDTNINHLVKGNKSILGTRIEYFEKPLSDVLLTIENDYTHQNNASLLIFGKSEIIYDRYGKLQALKQYVNNKFKEQLLPLNDNEAKEQVAILNNRMEKLEQYAQEDNLFFEHLYQLTIDKIRSFYHSLSGITYIETSKCFRIYTDEEYKKSFSIDKIPEPEFIKIYFELITNNTLNKIQKYELLEKMYTYAKRNIYLNEQEFRIPIKSKNIGINVNIIEPNFIEERKKFEIPKETLERTLKFINEMNYVNNEHVLGVILYGSSLTGFNNKSSDIDIYVVFDDEEKEHLIRGLKYIAGQKIEYFERPISDLYLSIENDYLNQNNASYSIIGQGAIIFERENKLSKLQQYVIDRFKYAMPPLDTNDSMEQISILNNRMEKLKKLASDNSPYFDHYYHLVIEKIRKFYHKVLGISKISTSKVYRIYTDEKYRNSIYKQNPDSYFVEQYLKLISINCEDKKLKYQMVQEYFDYASRNIFLEEDYRINIKSRNIGHENSQIELDSLVPKTKSKKLIIDKN